MPQGSSSGQDQDDTDAEFVEVDPSGRYGRYKEILGKGAFKKVYRGFDELEGIEVAWNQVKVADLLRNSEDMDRLYSEVHLLKTLKHKNIIKFYNSWVDAKHGHINFITEIFTSGTLRQYRKKHKHVDLRALKKWSRQILEGLLYLHSHDPPVIHRDLKCDNIFINGNQGEVKIGDLGLAAILQQAQSSAHSVIGTPEFMAPELYEEEYNELVDIYAFGMCLLELVTFEYPYVECANAAQIFKKVSSGIKPASLAKVADPVVRAFIDKCIAKASDRLPAKELLEDPFLQPNVENDESVGRSLQSNPQYSDDGSQQFDDQDDKDPPPEPGRDFMVEGQRKDVHTILVKLRIADSAGLIRNIRFPFYIESDTSVAVASEMVQELDLTDQDVSAIAAMIDSVIHSIIPDWEPKDDNIDEEVVIPDDSASENKEDALTLSNSPNLVLERTPSGRKYWSDLPKGLGEDSPGKSAFSNYAFNPDSVVDGGKSPHSCRNEGNSVNGSVYSDVEEEEAGAASSDSQFGESNTSKSLGFVINGEHYLELNYTLLEEDESEDSKIIMVKLEQLLVEQQKELDELKTGHELAVSDLLKEFPPEMQEKILVNYERKGLN